jgi:putative redox protein
METACIKYLGNLRTEAVHLQSGNKIITDAPVDNQGKGEAFSPTDLVGTALGTCMLTIMGISANTHNFDLVGTEVKITKVMFPDPRRIGEVKVAFNFPANNYSAKEKRLIEHAAKTCPVAHSLHPDLKQNISFNYQD